MSSRRTNIIRSYDRVGWLVIFFHSLSLSPLIYLGAREELGHLLPSTMWPMPYFAKVCHIIRIDVKSKDFGTALAMWESWHRCAHRPTCINKSIKPTTPASHSPKQVFFYCLGPLSLPRKCFFIAWVNLAPEQSRWSRLGHQVSNGGASMPNASQVNLAHVLAYIAHFCTPSVPNSCLKFV